MAQTSLEGLYAPACRAASQAGRVAGYLRSRDARTIADDLLNLARRHPSESLLAAALAGLLMGRMLFDRSGGGPE